MSGPEAGLPSGGAAVGAAGLVAGALGRIRAQGGRVTVARVAVLEVLSSSSEHLSADDIAAAVQTVQPAVHRATVYRTLDSLVEAGVVSHTHLGHGAAVYHLIESGHIHGQCQKCGAIIDVDSSLLAPVAAELLRQHGFVLDPDHGALLGTCTSCTVARG